MGRCKQEAVSGGHPCHIRAETPGDITLQTSCHRFNNQGPSSKNGAPRPGVSFVVFEEEILDS